MARSWIVTTRHEPPSDWGFKPSWWHDHYYRVTVSKLHAQQLARDIVRLEINGKSLTAKIKPFRHDPRTEPPPLPRDEQVSEEAHQAYIPH